MKTPIVNLKLEHPYVHRCQFNDQIWKPPHMEMLVTSSGRLGLERVALLVLIYTCMRTLSKAGGSDCPVSHLSAAKSCRNSGSLEIHVLVMPLRPTWSPELSILPCFCGEAVEFQDRGAS